MLCSKYYLKVNNLIAILLFAICALMIQCYAPVVAVENITLSPVATLLDSGKSISLILRFQPSTATNRGVTWLSSNSAIATINSEGQIKGLNLGTTTITATSKDGDKTTRCEITVIKPVISITEFKMSPMTLDLELSNVQRSKSTITVIITPRNASNQDFTWRSSDESIASVSALGVVTGLQAGRCKITAQTLNKLHSAECEITVTGTTQTPLTGISLSPTSISVNVLATETIVPVFTPTNATHKGLTWSTSDREVVSIQGAAITGLKAGNAIVSVVSEDGGLTATCAVTVIQPAIPVISVLLDASTINMITGVGEQKTLYATVKPTSATNKAIQWTSSDPSVMTIANGVITGINAGSAIATVITVDGAKTATCNVNVRLAGIRVTGVAVVPTTLQLILNDPSKTITANITPTSASNLGTTWTTSNSGSAPVTSLNTATTNVASVQGKSVGNFQITVRTSDGNFSAICDVSVIERLNLPSFSLASTSITNNGGITLEYTIAGVTNSPQFSWSNAPINVGSYVLALVNESTNMTLFTHTIVSTTTRLAVGDIPSTIYSFPTVASTPPQIFSFKMYAMRSSTTTFVNITNATHDDLQIANQNNLVGISNAWIRQY